MFFRILFSCSIARSIRSFRFHTPPLDSYSANDPLILVAQVVQWQNIRILSAVQPTSKGSRFNPWRNPFFFLLGVSWSDHFYIPVGNTTGNGDSEKHMVVVLAIIVSSENSSPSCDFFDRCYCTVHNFYRRLSKFWSLFGLGYSISDNEQNWGEWPISGGRRRCSAAQPA